MGLLSRLFGKSPENKFAKLIMSRMKRAGYPGKLRYDAELFCIFDAEDRRIFLGNSFAEYGRADRSEREVLLNQYLSAWHSMRLQVPDDVEDVKADLLPVLRARTYYEVDLKRADPTADLSNFPYEIIADHLCVSLVYDLPSSMMTVSQEQLGKWGITLYEGLELAKANLRETTKTYAQIGGLYSFINGDSYDASRLVLTDLIGNLELFGKPVAMVPNRETLLVAGSEDDEALTAMLHFAEEGLNHERYISGVALVLNEGDWEPWLPDSDHPLFNQFAKLRMQTIGQEYASQQQVLQSQIERDGRDTFVGSYSALQRESDGGVQSYCVWSEGVPTLLPKTALVMLAGPGEGGGIRQRASGTWEDVERIAGHLMQLQDIYPLRYLVESFPTSDELAQIGSLPG